MLPGKILYGILATAGTHQKLNQKIRYEAFGTLMFTMLFTCFLNGQINPMFSNLPVGKYAVGFKIVTLTDSSRVTKPLYNYFGEKETGDRYQRISIHIWYPSKSNTGHGVLTYNDYCYNHLLNSVFDQIDDERRSGMVNSMRNSFEGFFGKIKDEEWQQVLSTKMLAQKEAIPSPGKFPLLIGQLRPLSTTVTNELMASNGYVVAMTLSTSGRIPFGYIADVTDLQQAIAYLNGTGLIEENSIGTYGFSGSGFPQVLLAMNDPRIGALADIESALYGEGIWKLFSSSNYYDISKLRVPFLHIYGKYLAHSDVKFDEFLNTRYSHRYHLLLNQSRLHHWDVATEGRASTTVVHARGDLEPGAKASFELANIYLLHFFNTVLKKEQASKRILENKSAMKGYNDTLWSIRQYPALQPPPDKLQFEELINRKGIDEAIRLAQHFRKVDSTADFIHENALNGLSQTLQEKNQLKDGIKLMRTATEFYSDRAWLWRNLARMQEADGDIKGAIQSCEKVLELLKDTGNTGLSFDQRIKRSAKDMLERLKKMI